MKEYLYNFYLSGKEYNEGRLEYEGDYVNGKRNGNGKEYDMNNKLIFCGEFKDGKRWNGIGYNGANNIVYELKNGKEMVKENNFGYLIFGGDYLNGNKVSNKSC